MATQAAFDIIGMHFTIDIKHSCGLHRSLKAALPAFRLFKDSPQLINDGLISKEFIKGLGSVSDYQRFH
jgi:hypothetical protein